MSTVVLQPEHLNALAGDLRRYRSTLTDLLARAQALEAGSEVAGLSGAPAWAGSTARDLDGRVELLSLTDQTVLGGLRRLGLSPRELAGSTRPIAATLSDAALALDLEPVTGPWDLSRRSNESLDDWGLRIATEAAARYSHLPLAPQAATVLDWYGAYGDVLASWAASSAAGARLARYAASGPLLSVLDSAWVATRIPAPLVTGMTFFPTRWATLAAPGFTPNLFTGQLINRAIALEGLADPRLSTLGRYTGNVFGRPWMNPRIPTTAGPVGRGASNLVTVFRNPMTSQGYGRLASVGRTAGALRSLGVVGGIASTGYDIANLAAQGNPVEALKREGAGYVADLAHTGFDASLTAAMIAPSPITWGAVAVTGTVWAGAEIVDHWDDVSAAAGTAVDWADDRLDDAAGAIGDAADGALSKAGDAVDAVKSVDLNPTHWF
ncbi:MAG: hypothetical protein JWO60_3178 [Frankiales bacterium]|nr:hypothetical protein [Frankiales bacterium]